MDIKCDYPCAMGVDVGKHLHVTIGMRKGPQYAKIIKLTRVSAFSDLYDLQTRFNVRSIVLDLYPETRTVREFCAAIPCAAWGCQYSEEQRGAPAYDDINRVVSVNRTEISDASHALVAPNTAWMLDLPRRNAELKVFASHLTHMVRTKEEDQKTKVVKFRYRGKIGGPDDYRHSLNYFILALNKLAVASVVDGPHGSIMRRPKGRYPW